MLCSVYIYYYTYLVKSKKATTTRLIVRAKTLIFAPTGKKT